MGRVSLLGKVWLWQDKFNALRPITADQVPWRLIRSANGLEQINSPRNNSFAGVGQILEGIEIKKAEDPSKPSIPIFGKSLYDFYFMFRVVIIG